MQDMAAHVAEAIAVAFLAEARSGLNGQYPMMQAAVFSCCSDTQYSEIGDATRMTVATKHCILTAKSNDNSMW